MADNITENQIQRDVQDILKDADLTKLSSKKIRLQLEEKYASDLTDRKKEIDMIVLEAVDALQAAAGDGVCNGEDEDGEDSGDHSSGSDLDAPEDMGPPVKKKKIQKKESGTDEESDEKEDDAELARKLQEEEDFQGRRTRGGKKPPQTKKPAKVTKPKSEGGKKNNTYSKECMLSPALAVVMGTDRMKRSDVVKRMWEVVKERDLQDPKNKSFMLCDDELYKVFGRKRVKTFGMMKYLTDHIFTPEDYETYFGVSVEEEED